MSFDKSLTVSEAKTKYMYMSTTRDTWRFGLPDIVANNTFDIENEVVYFGSGITGKNYVNLQVLLLSQETIKE